MSAILFGGTGTITSVWSAPWLLSSLKSCIRATAEAKGQSSKLIERDRVISIQLKTPIGKKLESGEFNNFHYKRGEDCRSPGTFLVSTLHLSVTF